MKKLMDIEVSEKEWKHIQLCYRRFAEDENCQSCPMGWVSEELTLYNSKVNKTVLAKMELYNDDLCLCHQFKEFAKARHEEKCPCYVYAKPSTAFNNLNKLIARWDEEMNDEG